MTCIDCGAPRARLICGPCARTAERLGHTIDERLAMLGAPTLMPEPGPER